VPGLHARGRKKKRASARVQKNCGGERDLFRCALLAFLGQTIREAQLARAAKLCDRTEKTLRSARTAKRRAKLHHRLVPFAGGFRVKQMIRIFLQIPPTICFAQVAANRAEPREHAGNIAIEHSVLRAVGNAEDRSRSVVADAGEREGPVEVSRKFSTVFCDDLLRGLLQIACAAVITEPRPQSQDFFLRSLGESADIRETREESFVIRDHRCHARLLEHDLREPDAVWVACAPPRQIALELVEPSEQSSEEHTSA